MTLKEQGKKAREASVFLSSASSESKNGALEAISAALLSHKEEILSANALDIENAKAKGMAESMIDRLALDEKRLSSIAAAVLKVKGLDDPTGRVLDRWTLENGIEMTKISVPIGVIGIIYESRPNVTVDAAVLCLKSGNAAFLRGGSETINSNIALEKVMQDALESVCFPRNA